MLQCPSGTLVRQLTGTSRS